MIRAKGNEDYFTRASSQVSYNHLLSNKRQWNIFLIKIYLETKKKKRKTAQLSKLVDHGKLNKWLSAKKKW